MKRVDVILATYNGEKFLKAQLDSLLNQSYPLHRIFLRDDLSSDQTQDIISEYKKKHNDKIIVVPSSTRLGVIANFSSLLQQIDHQTDYLMFCDQDDIWLSDKVESTLNKMLQEEKISKPNTPILLHTDLKLVDGQLKEISTSYIHYSGLNPESGSTFSRLLTQNCVTGCTMMLNKPLIELTDHVPNGIVMHDWWIALVAACFGKVVFLNKPTILYRQHGNNTVGAKKNFSLQTFLRSWKRKKTPSTQQAQIFYQKYHNQMSLEQIATITAYIQLSKQNFWKRRYQMIRHKFYKHGILRNAVAFVFAKKYV